MSIGAINATELGFQKSIDIIIMVVLGGLGSISGATLAAVLLTILPEMLRDPPPLWPFGVGLLFVMLTVQYWRHQRHWPSLIIVAIATIALEAGRQICLARDLNMADYRLIIYALLLILMMILRPQGLFGVREIWNAWHVRPLKPKRDTAGGGKSGTAGKVPTL